MARYVSDLTYFPSITPLVTSTIDHPSMWATTPSKLPQMAAQGNPIFNATEIRGTYSARGYKNLHIVGINDNEGVPSKVNEMRDHQLKSGAKIFGKLVGEISTVAIWDSTEMYGTSLIALHHVGENVYYGEKLQLFAAHGGFESVLAPTSVSF